MSLVESGKHIVLINSKTADLKCIKVPRNQLVQLKSLPFNADHLIGQHFGQSYTISNQKLICISKDEDQFNEPAENCDRTNEFIRDDGSTQTLSQDDIEGMKTKGIAGSEIVRSIAENSITFKEKTEFSKVKWLKKKINKHQPNILVKKPSIRLFCTSSTSKLRPDILSKILNNSNVWSGSKVIVVECLDDLITSAVAQRVTESGTVVQVFDQKVPHVKFCRWLDLPLEQLNALIYYPVKFLNQLQADALKGTDESDSDYEGLDDDKKNWKIELKKRRTKELEVELPQYMPSLSLLKSEKFDSLIISATYDPLPVLELLWDSLKSSATLVIHTQYLSVVLTCADFVHKKGCSELTIVDHWFREVTVLPGRTRPDMRMQTGGGFILSCFKLVDGIFQHGPDSLLCEKSHDSEQTLSSDSEVHLSKKIRLSEVVAANAV